MSIKKDAITRAAKILFAEKGFRQTSVAELSRLTGAAEGTIFYHFKNKEAIFTSILGAINDRITYETSRFLTQREFGNGCDMLAGALSFYLDLAGTMRDELLILHRHYPYDMARKNLECQGLLESIYNRFWNLFERVLDRGKADGSVVVNSTRKTAMILYAMVDGIARIDTYRIYDAGALHNELMQLCRQWCAHDQ